MWLSLLPSAPGPRVNRDRLARVVTEILAPAPVAVLILALVARQVAGSGSGALAWGGLAIFFATGLPLLYLLVLLRRGRVTDRHVRLREQRPRLLLVSLASALVGTAILVALGAPRAIVGALAAIVAGLAVATPITLFWKISGHAAVAAGGLVTLVVLFGPRVLLLSPLVPLVCWARVRLGDHTPAQVAAGAGVGAAMTAAAIGLLTAGAG